MLRWEDLGPPPLLFNDVEMSRTVVPMSSSPGFNDMSFFALMFRAMVCQKNVLSVPDGAEDGWATKLQLVLSLERSIKQDYFHASEDAPPFERFTEQVAKGIIASTHLLLRRPPYKQHSGLVPSSDDFNVLDHSTRILQQDLASKSTEFAPWAWKSWVRWNALAIVLVELCSLPPGETYDAAYSVAVQSFNQYSSLIADTEAGMLWKPITKLMRQLQQLRHSNYRSEQTSSLANTLETPMSFNTSDFSIPNLAWNLDAENAFIPQGDQTTATSGDAQMDWFTFTDSMNIGYSIDGEHDLFWK